MAVALFMRWHFALARRFWGQTPGRGGAEQAGLVGHQRRSLKACT
jgi:hypothetical protein